LLRYDHLIGLKFEMGKQDCYAVIRSFYIDNFGITLPNYARPTDFAERGMEMYRDRYIKNGFRPLDVHPSQYQPGDIFLMSINASVANHAAVLVENGKILHHIVGQLSNVTPYKGLWRNNTVAVFRHKDVVLPVTTSQESLLEHLPAHVRRRIETALQANG
jgi:cell wall-associated NlpC family hydrolase